MFLNFSTMKLIIDAGNTVVKIAVFEGSSLVLKQNSAYDFFYDDLKKILFQFPKIDKAIASLVSKLNKEQLIRFCSEKKIVLLILSSATKVPFLNLYATPTTLGVDRVALMAAAVSKFELQNCLVIDTGSCITYDFINSKKEYFGGTISPGLQMRYTSLHQFTAQLPLLSPKRVNSFVGNSTENAIHAGVSFALETEISGVIEYFSNKYSDLIVILTGGDAEFLSKRFKNGIFVLPNFLIEGLNHILDYNTNK